jgi:hypothetical protein
MGNEEKISSLKGGEGGDIVFGPKIQTPEESNERKG